MLECIERAVGEEAVRRLLARPPRKLVTPMEGACGYIMRLADENMASFAEALELEHAAGAPAAWECLNGKLESMRPRLTHVARFCPHCLESTRYWLDAWEVPLADACSVCGRWLVDTCSDCGCRITWNRRKLLYCDCGTSLLAERSREAVPAAVQLSRTLVDRARGCSVGGVEVLNGLTLTECIEVCRYAAAVGGHFAYRPIRLVSELELLDRSWNTSTLAAEVLADWPNAFVRSLRERQSQAPEERQGSLHKVFDAVYRALRTDLSNPKFEFLRIAFATYVAEHWTGPIAKRNRNGLTALTRTMAWVPPSIAAAKLGLTVKQVRVMAAKGELPSQSRITEAGRRFIVVSNAFVQENAGRLSPGCSLRDASHVLALPQAWLRHLVPALCSDVHPPRPGGVWDVPKAWISGLKRVVASAPLASDPKSERMCTVQLALRNKLKKNAVAASFIRAIADGSGPQVWRKATTTAFGKLLVRWDEVCAWEESGAAVGPAAIALPIAARMLGVKEEVVYALVRAGLVKASADRGRQKLARYTSQRWLDEFNAQYVFGRDVAAHFGRSSKWMAQWLRAQGIAAVAGPGVDSCRQLVYSRAAVTSASALGPGGEQLLHAVRSRDGGGDHRQGVGKMKKPRSERVESPSTSSRRRRLSSAPSPLYLPASEVRALMSTSDTARRMRMQAADMISVDEAALLMQTTRRTIRAWMSSGCAIGLRNGKEAIRLPQWQFQTLIWAALPRLSVALETKNGWALLAFLESPLGSLNGRTPRQAIEQGDVDRVVSVAEYDGT